MNILGLPRIILPYAIYEKCMGWMDATHNEVSWRGLADWDENAFRVTEVFLPKQRASSAHVEVFTAKDGGDFGKWLTDCIREGKYQNPRGECRYKWHMHKHPGFDWSSLFESSTDENNTERFGVRDIDWMMVGRAVSSGKFGVCLEIFKPFRISFDFLPVFVEYQGALIRVSEPEKKPTASALSKIIFESKLSLKEEALFGEIHVEEREFPTTTSVYPQRSFDDDFDYCESFHTRWENGSSPPNPPTSPLYHPPVYTPVYAPRKERIIRISALGKNPVLTNPYCLVKREDGLTFIDIKMKVSQWDISIEKIPLNIQLPEVTSIREEAKKEVKAKVSEGYSYVYSSGQKAVAPIKKIAKKIRRKKGKEEKNGNASQSVSRLPESETDQEEFPDNNHRGRRYW